MSKIFHNIQECRIEVHDERFYTIDHETFYASVTTKLEAWPKEFGFYEWLKGNGFNSDVILEKAAKKGSNVHDGCDRYLKGETVTWADEEGKPIYTFEEWKMILKFVEFWEAYNPELIANEFSIVSDRYRLGGTVDILCKISGKLWLIDIKTSNYIHTTHELQLAAYATMFNDINKDTEMFHVEHCGVLWLNASVKGPDKTGKKIQGHGWQLKTWDRPYQEAWKVFEHVAFIWDEQHPNYKPKTHVYPDRICIRNKS